VYVWEGGPALVQTVDFFTPIVDDPYIYGQIAAANALSDIYAMGARPLTALAIAAFPESGLEDDAIGQIFKGGFDKLREAGTVLLGGHTIKDKEIKFGYAVTGAVDPTRLLTNGGAQRGDVLILTKPIGTGVVGTAIKFDRVTPSLVEEAVTSMRTLNRAAAEALANVAGVHSCTDITGFGLIGHASEMADGSDATLVIDAASVPVFAGVADIVRKNQSGGMSSNREHFASRVEMAADVPAEVQDLLYDPQTSGGLLVAVEGSAGETALEVLRAAGVAGRRIGRVVERATARIIVR
jgi:selenide, water dikinase